MMIAFQFIVNLILSVIWLLLTGSYTLNNFVLGLILGALFVFLFSKVLPQHFYLYRVYKIIKLAVVFLIELIKANIDVLKIILRPKINNHPGFFVYNTDLKQIGKSSYYLTLLR